MSQIQTLPALCPIDFSISRSPTCDDSFCGSYREKLNWTTNALVNDIILSSSPSLRITADQFLLESREAHPRTSDNENIFPSLPPLLHGHSEVHLRNGIMNASRLAAAHEPDAEKAFFVGDLSQVYRQHVRWKKCLPGIQPFYGSYLNANVPLYCPLIIS